MKPVRDAWLERNNGSTPFEPGIELCVTRDSHEDAFDGNPEREAYTRRGGDARYGMGPGGRARRTRA